MKLHKYLAIGIAMLAFTACSDDDDMDYNTNGNVSVYMPENEQTFDETSGIINVPVDVDGIANGMIKVNVTVAAQGTTPATEDENYLVTSKTIFIPADKRRGNVEISIVNDRYKNDDRTFVVTITSAEGATVAQRNSTLVKIEDNDQYLYGRLQSKWLLTAEGTSFSCNITGLSEGEPGYGQTLFIEFPGSLGNEQWTNSIRCTVTETDDDPDYAGFITIPLGQVVGSNIPYPVNSTVSYALDMVLYTVTPSGQLANRGNLYMYVSKDESRLEFPENSANTLILRAMVRNASGDGYQGYLGDLGYYVNVSLSRK